MISRALRAFTPSRRVGNMIWLDWLDIDQANIKFDLYFRSDDVENLLDGLVNSHQEELEAARAAGYSAGYQAAEYNAGIQRRYD